MILFREAAREALREYGVRWVLNEVAYELDLAAIAAAREDNDAAAARVARQIATAVRDLTARINIKTGVKS